MDHLIINKVAKIYKFPPRMSKDGFDEEELDIVAREKLDELRKRLREATREFKEAISESKGNWLAVRVHFFTFEKERYYISRWQRYWQSLRKRNLVDVRAEKEKLNVEKAKEFPLEELYPGELRRAGRLLTGSCPFHNPEGARERSRSFFVYPDGHYHCFSCGQHGDSIDFLMTTQKIEFKEAVRRLQ